MFSLMVNRSLAQELNGVKPGISINGAPCLIQNLIYSCTPRTCDSIIISVGDSVEFCTYQQISLNTDSAYWLRWHFYGCSNLPDTIFNGYPATTPQCYSPRWDTAGTYMAEIFYNGVLSAYPNSDCYQQGPSHWYVKVVVLPDPNSVVSNISGETISIAPNPSDGIFSIQLPSGEHLQTVTVFDFAGRVVYTGATRQIDLLGAACGIYCVRIVTDHSEVSLRVIVQ